jgi:hypothetical protein
MTKQKFIDEATRLGFKKHQDLVEKMGYNPRTLSRFKVDDNISKKFAEAFEAYKNDAKPVQKEDLKIVAQEVAETPQKPKEVKAVQSIEKEEKVTGVASIVSKKIIKKEVEPATEEKPKEIGIDISNEEYHSSNNMGVSKLKVMIDNAKEFEAKYITKTIERKETEALIVGKLHHTFVMEAHKFDEDYLVIDMPARPVKDDLVEALETLGGEVDLKENGKGDIVVADTVESLKKKIEAKKTTSTKTICTKEQVELATQTSQKALNSWFELIIAGKTLLKAQLKDLLELDKCYVEKTFYGTINGVDVQVRPDILLNLGLKSDIWFVIDLKTLEVATPAMFVKQGGTFFWDMQEQFYLDVLAQNGINAKAFYFNCAGKKKFSGAGFYEWGISTKDEAKKVVKAGINKYKYCTENNIFSESKFDYVKMRFEAITTLDVPVYRQYAMGDLGV